ncbi:MAG: MBL fold metallo-hydrolase [Bacteroidota bacterium]
MVRYFQHLLLSLSIVFPVIAQEPSVSLIVLGTVQDGGSPHIGCKRDCCALLFEQPDPSRKVVSLGIIDHQNNMTFLLEATPNLPQQLKLLNTTAQMDTEAPSGIFVTHAHIGHYIGLMYLGKEAMNANKVPVYTLPRMKRFLETNGPWSQLVRLGNILPVKVEFEETIQLSRDVQIIPLQVPHRDEFSETAGFKIIGPDKKVLFIPDIDKWEHWGKDIRSEIKNVDYAFLDATFFDGDEINTRDLSEIPHPFVQESIALFKTLPLSERQKIHFIHFNHTNPLLRTDSNASAAVLQQGYQIARFGQLLKL